VVALAHDLATGSRLRNFLQEEGYGRVLVATAPDDIRDFLLQPNLAVLILDGDLGTLESLQLMSDLKAEFPSLPPVILAVAEVSAGIVLAAHRQGVAQVLVKPYALDAAFSELLDQILGA
jgi:DNA-binding response OmpR family regulator